MNKNFVFGEFIQRDFPLNIENLEIISAKAERASGKIQEIPIDKILEILDHTARNWLNPSYPFRREALQTLPSFMNTSRPMVEESIDSLFTFLQRESLTQIIRSHLGGTSFLDDFEYIASYDGYLKAQPLGIILHIIPEYSFTGGIENLILGFISKNVNILKTTSQSYLFPLIFAKSLKEVDEDGCLYNSFALLNCNKNNCVVDPLLGERCDGFFYHRGNKGPDVCIEEPFDFSLNLKREKYSFSIITSEGFSRVQPERVYRKCARDVILWEQRTPSSPDVIYVQKDIVGKFIENFPKYLESMKKTFPQKNLSLDEKIKILNAREFARFEEAKGGVILHHSPRSNKWTLIYEESLEFKKSPQNRTIYIKPFVSWGDILGQAVKIKGNIHTVGILAGISQLKTFARALARVGVSRITSIGSMGDYNLAAPKNFDFPLRRMIRWISVEGLEKRLDLGERISPSKSVIASLGRLKDLLRYARDKSSFYRERLSNIDIRRLDENSFINVPFLSFKDILQHAPPAKGEMLTSSLSKGHIFVGEDGLGQASFNVYSVRELEEVSGIFSDIYQISGLTKEDVVLNLFMSVFLSASFITTNLALKRIGCVTLPVSGNAEIEHILHYINIFHPTALIGNLDTLVRLAQESEKLSIDLKIDKVFYGGSPINENQEKLIKDALKVNILGSMGYTCGIAGLLGYQCRRNRGSVYHLLNEYMFVEVIDPKSGLPVEKGQKGELVATNLNRRLMPIIRYRTGFFGKILKEKCSCNALNPLLEIIN